MNGREQTFPRWLWVTALFVALIAFVYATRAILLPFVAGFAVAYLLDPSADLLERWGFKRWLATSIIILIFFLLVAGFVLLVWPLATSQIVAFIDNAPEYAQRLRPYLSELLERLGPERAQEALDGLSAKALEIVGNAAEELIDQGIALFNLITLLLITPVVAFYLLRDWDQMVARVKGWLPHKQKPTIEYLLSESDRVLAGFVRGQLLVALAEAVLYAAGWAAIGLNFAIVLGIIAGLLSFIPFVGPLFTALLALLVAFGQSGGDWVMMAAVFGVFLVVQAIESALLVPRFLGDRVRLHPVWVLFAVFAGGELMGITGALIAVPVAAVAAVLTRYWLSLYLAKQGGGGDPGSGAL